MLYLNGNDFAGSLDTAFCDSNIAFFEFVADCQGELPKVKCSCCTSCCNTQGSDCKTNIEHLPENSAFLKTNSPTTKPAFPPTFAPDPVPSVGGVDTTIQNSAYMSKLKSLLATVSDANLLETKHTDQFKAFMWMVRLDPNPLNLDTAPPTIVIQKYLLALIYVSMNGKEWKNQHSFLTDANVCDWKGLTCNDAGEIVSLVLENNNLQGTLVREIGVLGPNLEELQLGMNKIHGSLPTELGLLSGLTTFDVFDNNNITGTVPTELSLQFLPNIKKFQLVGTSIVGNLDPLFCTVDTENGAARNISANCFDASVSCSCCKVCCDAAGNNCRVNEENN